MRISPVPGKRRKSANRSSSSGAASRSFRSEELGVYSLTQTLWRANGGLCGCSGRCGLAGGSDWGVCAATPAHKTSETKRVDARNMLSRNIWGKTNIAKFGFRIKENRRFNTKTRSHKDTELKGALCFLLGRDFCVFVVRFPSLKVFIAWKYLDDP